MYAAIYFPTHHSKRGEINAVGHLSPNARTRTRPTFNIIKPASDNDDPIEYHLSDIASVVVKSWGTAFPLYFDFPRYGPDEKAANGRHPAEYFFDCGRQLRLQGIPVAGPVSTRGPGYGYIEAAARIAHRDGRGAALRIPYRDLVKADDLEAVVDDTLKALSLTPAMVDVFLDFEALADLSEEDRSEENLTSVATEALQVVKDREFRNLVLCGSSIPEPPGMQYNWKPLRVPRIELKVWQTLLQRNSNLQINFGDNGVTYVHDRSGKSGPPPSRIRLSTPTDHILWRAPKGNYRKLCSDVVKGDDFDRTLLAWGLGELYACGAGRGSEGSPTDWVARDTNLHLEGTTRFVEAALGRYGRLAGLTFADTETFPWLQSGLDTVVRL